MQVRQLAGGRLSGQFDAWVGVRQECDAFVFYYLMCLLAVNSFHNALFKAKRIHYSLEGVYILKRNKYTYKREKNINKIITKLLHITEHDLHSHIVVFLYNISFTLFPSATHPRTKSTRVRLNVCAQRR